MDYMDLQARLWIADHIEGGHKLLDGNYRIGPAKAIM